MFFAAPLSGAFYVYGMHYLALYSAAHCGKLSAVRKTHT